MRFPLDFEKILVGKEMNKYRYERLEKFIDPSCRGLSYSGGSHDPISFEPDDFADLGDLEDLGDTEFDALNKKEMESLDKIATELDAYVKETNVFQFNTEEELEMPLLPNGEYVWMPIVWEITESEISNSGMRSDRDDKNGLQDTDESQNKKLRESK